MLKYENLFKIYNQIPWYLRGSFDKFGCNLFMIKYNEMYNKELEETYKNIFPKKKKIDLRNLPEEVVAPIKKKWQDKFLFHYSKKMRQIKKLSNLMNKLANEVEIILPSEQNNLIYSSSSSTYRTTGNGNTYARKDVIEKSKMLLDLGYKTEVKAVSEFPDSTDFDTRQCMNYQLWANIKDWQYDCIIRRASFNVLDWAVSCWANGTNPKVYSPMMDDETYYKSLDIYTYGYKKP